ncbi:MAG TPA: RDD family protein [Acidimicrobiales bacterium]|nr:RDD family protein [Acidimicrobiales bacterium]
MIGFPLAPWWKRLVAIIIDGFTLGIFSFIVFALLGIAAFHGQNTTPGNPPDGAAIAGALVAELLVGAIPGALYYGLMNGSARGQTLGKMALGIAVRDARNGGPIGFWRGAGRFLIIVVFDLLLVVPVIINYLSPLWDKRRQAWHDHVAHSVVVDLRP